MDNVNQYNYRIENLRAFAILTVVLGHSIILYSSSWNLYHSIHQVLFLDQVKDVINLYQMPLFIALSGYLFAFRAPRSFFPFLQKKAKRLLVPFLIVGICFMIPLKLLVSYPSYQGKSFVAAVLLLLNGSDTGHLWFLPTLFCIFLIAYGIVRVLGNRASTWAMATAFGLALFSFRQSIPFYFPLVQYLTWIMQFFWSFCFGALLYHLSPYLFLPKRRIKFLAGAAAMVFLSLLLCRFAVVQIPTVIISIFIVTTLFLAAPNRKYSVLHTLSKYSFGIYLFHSPLIYLTFSFIPDSNPALVVFINFVVLGSTALLITKLLSGSKLRVIIGA